MKTPLHDPRVKSLLRPLRPYYDRIFNRRPRFTESDAPAASLRGLRGRAIFLISFGRSGTTVFCDCLSSHPDIVTFGEVLNEEAYYSFFNWLKRRGGSHLPSAMQILFYRFIASKVAKNRGKLALFDMKIESLHTIEGNWRTPGYGFKFFEGLVGSGNPVILLERRDLVARYLSGQIAVHRSQFHSFQKAEAADTAPFDIDIDRMKENVLAARTAIAYIKDRFRQHDRFLTLAYEDLFEPDGAGAGTLFSKKMLRDLAGFLQIEGRFDPRPRISRVSDGKTSRTYIANSEAVENFRLELEATEDLERRTLNLT
jgi:hypothetical protein